MDDKQTKDENIIVGNVSDKDIPSLIFDIDVEDQCKEETESTSKTKNRRSKKKIIIVTILLAAIILAAVVTAIIVIIPSQKYNEAIKLAENEEYDEAIAILEELDDYKDTKAYLEEFKLKKSMIDAMEMCSSTGTQLSSDKTSITVDSKNQYDSQSLLDIATIIGYLQLPDTLINEMCSTTALMGRQTKIYGDVEVSWSYHPDNGLDAYFRIIE